jgi:hypothetical protein
MGRHARSAGYGRSGGDLIHRRHIINDVIGFSAVEDRSSLLIFWLE